MSFQLETTDVLNFAHIHIPRTAGMSVYWYFEQVFGAKYCRRYGTSEDVQHLYTLDRSHHANVRFVAAHAPTWVVTEKLADAPTFVFSIVRDPLMREISAFQHIKSGRAGTEFQTCRNMDDYIAMLESNPHLQNVQKKYLCTRYELQDADVHHVLAAYLSSGYAYCAIDKMYVLQEYLRNILPTDMIFERENTGKSNQLTQFSPVQLRKLESLIADDIKLYAMLSAGNGWNFSDRRFRWKS